MIVNRFNEKIFRAKNTEDLEALPEILRITYFYPEDIIVQHAPVKEKVKKPELNRLRNGVITDTLTLVEGVN